MKLKEVKLIQMALGTVGIRTDEKSADLINITIMKAKELGADFSIKEAAKIQVFIEDRYQEDKK